MTQIIPLAGLAIATLGGAAIGFERQWSGHATGPHARFGGLRTFTMIGALGGVAGGFQAAGWTALAAVLFGSVTAIVAIGYAARSAEDVDATTEIAAMAALTAATLAGTGQIVLASGMIASTVALLLEKGRLHALAGRVDDVAFRASARFAVLALVVLPLLPSGSFGPFDAIRPRELWALVLFFSGLSFAAWMARRLLGPTNGVVVTGAIGGILSSTTVTFSFARSSRAAGADTTSLALGTIAACTVMPLRVMVASSFLNWPVGFAFASFAWPAFVAGLAALALGRGRATPPASVADPAAGSPLQLGAALKMAAFFQLAMFAVNAVVAWWGAGALMLTSSMVGLTDLDALTVSVARAVPSLDAQTAGQALATGMLANTLLKLVVSVAFGSGSYRLVAGAALATIAAITAAMLLTVS